jgi:hypothetical protein
VQSGGEQRGRRSRCSVLTHLAGGCPCGAPAAAIRLSSTPLLTLVTDRFREVKIPFLFAVRVQGVAMAVNAHRFDQSLGEERALVRAAVSRIARSTSGWPSRSI